MEFTTEIILVFVLCYWLGKEFGKIVGGKNG